MTERSRSAAQIRLAKPLVTAYVLGLLSSTSPRLIRTLLLWGKGKLTLRAAWLQAVSTLRRALSPNRFPAFCATLVGGSTVLQEPLALLFSTISLSRHAQGYNQKLLAVLAKFAAAFVSALAAFSLLNRQPQASSTQTTPISHLDVIKPGPFDEPPELGSNVVDDAKLRANILSRAGKTMDLTLLAAVRACDVLISKVWDRTPASMSKNIVSRSTPTILFCFSAATIMHAWFYSPSRLPQTYNQWISAAAELDDRLLLTLRHARYGTWTYGIDTGMASLLGSMCHDYGLPEELGDPAKTIPIPCELVHMGCGKNCEKHAVRRFLKGWIFAARMYAPLQLIVLLRHVLLDTTRSSAFLGAFIALFYYGVCLSRTRLGPRIFSSKTVTPQMWDSGLCVLGGCLLCGTSILVEQSRKRLEILFFVLPRAAATWFPRRYLPEHQWKEHVTFAVSAAVVLTSVQEDPKCVRGVLGNLLTTVMKID
ncbi:hypothetical protein BU23DRAFT_587391 [Bimuria novae-zelandiae CBS 107.79]|uniref:Integral membrane protein n=1 Tax=Bimuria novae-zelandiae CBS 107.79 TaxID=1447943 RepID=A0A6A5VMN5_9PLEO|nr:hypothetical protein BU23DRAFT_587391 [Bimuria novae-zelandiae CBS 107.79]